MITIKLKHGLQPQEEQWLAKNIGPRLHYLHNSIGGQGWIAKHELETVPTNNGLYGGHQPVWNLTLEDDRYASWFLMMFPQ
jgi:hypothetical protein